MEFDPLILSRIQFAFVIDFAAVIFNPSFPYRFAHMVGAFYVTTGFVVLGVAAYRLARDRYRDTAGADGADGRPFAARCPVAGGALCRGKGHFALCYAGLAVSLFPYVVPYALTLQQAAASPRKRGRGRRSGRSRIP